MNLLIIVSHKIQYYEPLFLRLAERTNLFVCYVGSESYQHKLEGYMKIKEEKYEVNGISEVKLCKMKLKGGNSSFFNYWSFNTIGILRSNEITHIFSFGYYLWPMVQFYLAAKLLHIKVILRCDTFKPLNNGLLKSIFIRNYDAIIAAGTKSSSYYAKYNKNVVNLPHAIDDTKFKPYNLSTARKGIIRVLFVGQLIPRKNIEFLSSLIPVFEKNNIQLDVVGSGEQYHLLLEPKVVVHHNNLMQHELVQIYNQCDCLVLPSLYDSWGLVVNEALSCGLPCIVSDNAGVSDIIKDGQNGYVIDTSSVKPASFVELVKNCTEFRKDEIRSDYESFHSMELLSDSMLKIIKNC